MALIDSVKWDAQSNDIYAWKYPETNLSTVSVISDKLSKLDIQDKLTNLKQSLVSVASDGYIYVKSALE